MSMRGRWQRVGLDDHLDVLLPGFADTSKNGRDREYFMTTAGSNSG
jgi:hypothetical protein